MTTPLASPARTTNKMTTSPVPSAMTDSEREEVALTPTSPVLSSMGDFDIAATPSLEECRRIQYAAAAVTPSLEECRRKHYEADFNSLRTSAISFLVGLRILSRCMDVAAKRTLTPFQENVIRSNNIFIDEMQEYFGSSEIAAIRGKYVEAIGDDEP